MQTISSPAYEMHIFMHGDTRLVSIGHRASKRGAMLTSEESAKLLQDYSNLQDLMPTPYLLAYLWENYVERIVKDEV